MKEEDSQYSMEDLTHIQRVKLPVRFAKQTTPFTCASKAVQMILNYFNPEKYNLRHDLEMEILERSRLGRYQTATSPGLALYALEEGFEVDHLATSQEVFTYPTDTKSGYTMTREEFDEKTAMDRVYFEKARRAGLKTIVLDRLEELPKRLRTYLQKGIPVMAMLDFDGALHDIVIKGYWKNVFMTNDPAYGERSFLERDLLELINTRYGVSLLAIYPHQESRET